MGCKPKSVGLASDDATDKLHRSSGSLDGANATSPGGDDPSASATFFSSNASSWSSRSSMSSPAPPPPSPPPSPLPSGACVWSVPVLSEELDVLSLRYTAVNGPNVSVARTNPTLLAYPLTMHHATGGTLNLQLTLNTVSRDQLSHTHTRVFCVNVMLS